MIFYPSTFNPIVLYHILQKLLLECAFWVSVHMWFLWIFSESLMSRLPALTDQDFIRLSFARFEERCHMGDLFCFFGLSQVLLADGDGSARNTEHQATPIQAAGGSPRPQQEPGRSTESPSKGLLRVGSTVLEFSSFSGSLTKAGLN